MPECLLAVPLRLNCPCHAPQTPPNSLLPPSLPHVCWPLWFSCCCCILCCAGSCTITLSLLLLLLLLSYVFAMIKLYFQFIFLSTTTTKWIFLPLRISENYQRKLAKWFKCCHKTQHEISHRNCREEERGREREIAHTHAWVYSAVYSPVYSLCIRQQLPRLFWANFERNWATTGSKWLWKASRQTF